MSFLLGLVLPMFLLIPVGFALQKVQDKVREQAASKAKPEQAVSGTIYFSSSDTGATSKSFSFEARPSGAFRSKLT